MFSVSCGVPGCGKSLWLARAVPESARRMRTGGIIIDPAMSRAFDALPKTRDTKEALRRAYKGEVVVLQRPSPEEVDALCRVLNHFGRMALGVDELRVFATAHGTKSQELVILARIHRNIGVEMFAATQSYGDLSRDLVSPRTELRIYQCRAPRDLKRIYEDTGIPKERILSLKPFQYILA